MAWKKTRKSQWVFRLNRGDNLHNIAQFKQAKSDDDFSLDRCPHTARTQCWMKKKYRPKFFYKIFSVEKWMMTRLNKDWEKTFPINIVLLKHFSIFLLQNGISGTKWSWRGGSVKEDVEKSTKNKYFRKRRKLYPFI